MQVRTRIWTTASGGSWIYQYLNFSYLPFGILSQRAEYIKFFSVFFGEEEAANNIFESMEKRYDCQKVGNSSFDFLPHENLQKLKKNILPNLFTLFPFHQTEKSSNAPNVIWVSKSNNGWVFPTCPSMECNIIADAGTKLKKQHSRFSICNIKRSRSLNFVLTTLS